MYNSIDEIESIILKYFQLFGNNGIETRVDKDFLIHWVYDVDLEDCLNKHQYQSVEEVLIKLKMLGWVELKTEMIYRGKKNLPAKRYDTVIACIKNGRIYNNKNNKFIDLENLINL